MGGKTPAIGIVVGLLPKETVKLVRLDSGLYSWIHEWDLRKVDLSQVATMTNVKRTVIAASDGVAKSLAGNIGIAKCKKGDDFSLLYGICLAASRIKKPFPQEGDTVYYIIDDVNGYAIQNDSYNGTATLRDMLKLGRLFKTYEAAEEALKKIIAVFAANKEAIESD